ncbi:MAG: tetratricopeptide repeat protein [Myxococcota bacterium]|nr:tetratricopeptide repeat protein [Myxococcota bacterium]
MLPHKGTMCGGAMIQPTWAESAGAGADCPRGLLRALVLLLLVLCCSACTAPGVLSGLRGGAVLVVVDDKDPAVALRAESELERALALVPLRVRPTSAEGDLQETLAGDDGRLPEARRAAEERRLPWLLVVRDGWARMETTRSGQVLWRTRFRRERTLSAKLAVRLDRAVGGRRKILNSGQVRLAPAGELKVVRGLALEGRWEDYSAAVDDLAMAWPADPAVRTHVGLRDHLVHSDARRESLQLARAMAPDAESELLALALTAEETGRIALAVRVRELLTGLYPERFDYIPVLAEHYDLLGQSDRALSLCRTGDHAADRAKLLRLPPGTAPDQAPDALPVADLRFCTGWYLFEAGEWEFSALAYEDSIQLYETFGRWDELGESLNNAGAAMVRAERPLTAAATLRKAVDIREELSAPLPLATTRYNLAWALSDGGRLLEAVDTYGQAADDYDRAGRRLEALDALVMTLGVLVRVGAEQRFEGQGRLILERASNLSPSRDREKLIGNTWFELGEGRYAFRDLEGSIAAYLRSLRSWQQLEMRVEEGQTHYSMASPHLALRRFDEAHADLIRSLAVAVELSDSESILEIQAQLREIEELVDHAGQELPPIPPKLRRYLEMTSED